MPRSSLQLILVIVITLATIYYLSPGSESSSRAIALQEKLPKTYLNNARTYSYSEEGALTDVLEAESVTFYPTRKASVLVAPRMYSHNVNEDTWSASSQNGLYYNKRKVLTLTDNVVLTNDTNQVTLTTEELKIDLQKNTAISVVQVTVRSGESSTVADGMLANLDKQTVRLQPNVESVYVKPKPGEKMPQ
jgi:LPS export ABC transporter protein LptC